MKYFKRRRLNKNVDNLLKTSIAIEKLDKARHEAYSIGSQDEKIMINILINQALQAATGYKKAEDTPQ